MAVEVCLKCIVEEEQAALCHRWDVEKGEKGEPQTCFLAVWFENLDRCYWCFRILTLVFLALVLVLGIIQSPVMLPIPLLSFFYSPSRRSSFSATFLTPLQLVHQW